jgi:hypothetical protein
MYVYNSQYTDIPSHLLQGSESEHNIFAGKPEIKRADIGERTLNFI